MGTVKLCISVFSNISEVSLMYGFPHTLLVLFLVTRLNLFAAIDVRK